MKPKSLFIYSIWRGLMLMPGALMAASSIQFKTPEFEVTELDGFAEITLTCSTPAAAPIDVHGRLTNGTATQSTDYAGQVFAVQFRIGQTQAVCKVGIIDDGLAESDETVNLAITQVEGPAVAGGVTNAILTIHNSGPHVYIYSPGQGLEAGPPVGSLVIGLRRGGDTDVTLSVTYATGTNGTATPNVDFASVSGTIEFLAGEAFKQFTVPLFDDGFLEEPETIEVRLSDPWNDPTVDSTPQFGVILDDEMPTVDFDFAPEFFRWPMLDHVTVQPDGKIVLAGNNLYQGGQQVRLLRLHADGSTDRSFRCGLVGGIVQLLAAGHGRLLVSEVQSNQETRCVRLLEDGSLDESFAPVLNAWVALVQSDGKIILRDGPVIDRLNEDGSADTGFNDNISNLPIISMQEQGEHKLVVNLSALGSTVLIRLNPDGSRDTTFQEFVSQGFDFKVLSDGKIIVAAPAWLPGRDMSRLDVDGHLDSSFAEPQLFGDSYLPLPFADEGGRLYFNCYDGVARINEDGLLEGFFGYRTGRKVDIADIGWEAQLLWHQGAVLVWTPLASEVNGSPRALGRILVDGAPTQGFGFGNESGVIWTGPTVAASEAEGTASITVRRWGDLAEPATISYATRDGSARAGVHYAPTEGSLKFGPLEAEKSISVQLIRDEVFRGRPYFVVALSEPSVAAAAVDRPIRVYVRDREFGLVPGELLSRIDGSRQFEFDLTGSNQTYTVEGSGDLTNWSQAQVHKDRWPPAKSPMSVPVPPGESHLFYRARRN